MKYKLKPEARKFFKSNQTDILPLKAWEKLKVHINLLDELPVVYITKGIKEGSTTHISAYSGIDGSKFHFTLNIDEIDGKQHKKINIPKLMDLIQETTDKFFKTHLKNS